MLDLRVRSEALFVLASTLLGAGCASGSEVAVQLPRIDFVCSNGARFSVAYEEHGARITTSEGSWILPEKPSSLGRKFLSESAAFIHDEDRGVLNGLPGGPFRRCREAKAGEWAG